MTEEKLSQEEYDKLVHESIESLKEYLPNLIAGTEVTLDLFNKQLEGDAFNTLGQVINGLQWTFGIVNLTHKILEQMAVTVDATRITEVTTELEGAMVNKDIVLIKDLLEYEILEIIQGWNEQLETVEN